MANRFATAQSTVIEISNAEQTLDAFVKIGVLAEQRRNDDRAIEAAISLQQLAILVGERELGVGARLEPLQLAQRR